MLCTSNTSSCGAVWELVPDSCAPLPSQSWISHRLFSRVPKICSLRDGEEMTKHPRTTLSSSLLPEPARMLSWAVPRALGHPDDLSLRFPLHMGSYGSLLDPNGFFLNRHTTRDVAWSFNPPLFVFVLHLDQAPVSSAVVLSTLLLSPAS